MLLGWEVRNILLPLNFGAIASAAAEYHASSSHFKFCTSSSITIQYLHKICLCRILNPPTGQTFQPRSKLWRWPKFQNQKYLLVLRQWWYWPWPPGPSNHPCQQPLTSNVSSPGRTHRWWWWWCWTSKLSKLKLLILPKIHWYYHCLFLPFENNQADGVANNNSPKRCQRSVLVNQSVRKCVLQSQLGDVFFTFEYFR